MDMSYEPSTLSLDDVQRLDDQNRKEYIAFRRLFESEGWQFVLALVTQWQRREMENQLLAKNWDGVLHARGAFAAFQAILTLEQQTELNYLNIAQSLTKTESSDDE